MLDFGDAWLTSRGDCTAHSKYKLPVLHNVYVVFESVYLKQTQQCCVSIVKTGGHFYKSWEVKGLFNFM